MLIGVVSDTHIPKRAKRLPAALLEGLREVELILHCGDWSAEEAYRALSAIAPVYGVAGNTDGPDLVARFGWRQVVETGGLRIGIVHGHAGVGKTTPDRAYGAFADDPPDAVVFGHSHVPFLARRDGTLLFNPGSPTDKRRQSRYSFGLLAAAGGKAEARHVYFD